MSILLEALKKSERQRQLGQPPSLQTPVDEQTSSRHILNHWIPLGLLVLSIAVMAWFGWQQFRPPQEEATAEVALVEPEQATRGARTPTEDFQAEAEVPEGSAAAVSDSDEAKSRLRRSVSEFTASEVPDEPDPVETEVVPDQAAAEQSGMTTAEAMAEARKSIEKRRAEQAAAAEGEVAAGDLQPSGVGPDDAALEPHIAEPISFWELPQGVRDNMPVIKITVLVYADEPADRFLLSNGQRVVEKEEMEGGLILDEIRRDGAVFVYRKYRFLVKS